MILVVGCGFVGGTVADSLEEHDIKVIRIDPKLNDNKIEDFLNEAKGAVVAVPTPTRDGVCDDSFIRTVLDELGTEIPIMLKCTVPPNMLETYPDNVTYNPEFLRQATAKEDFDLQTQFILGGTAEGCSFWAKTFSYMNYNKANNPVAFKFLDRNTASMVKYMHNCWLATKVAFFHEVYDNLRLKDYNYQNMIAILSQFENIGPSHMYPGNDDGKLGFSGACFPKDTEAFYDFSKSTILKQVIETNKILNNTIK